MSKWMGSDLKRQLDLNGISWLPRHGNVRPLYCHDDKKTIMITENREFWRSAGLQCHGVHTQFHENRQNGSNLKPGDTYTDTHTPHNHLLFLPTLQ
jgi:hypothetical protein